LSLFIAPENCSFFFRLKCFSCSLPHFLQLSEAILRVEWNELNVVSHSTFALLIFCLPLRQKQHRFGYSVVTTASDLAIIDLSIKHHLQNLMVLDRNPLDLINCMK
jgi:hypothetical protein